MPNDVPDWSLVSVIPETAIPGSPFSFARDGGAHTISNLQIPVGCQWLAFGLTPATDLFALTVTGTTTGLNYASAQLVGLDTVTYVRVHPAIDPIVNISCSIANGVGSATLGVCFGYSPTVTDLDTLVPSPVFLENSAGTLLATENGSSGGPRLGTSQQFANASVWQAAAKVVPLVAVSLALNATAVIIAAAGGVTILLHWIELGCDGANAAGRWQLQDTNGGVVADIFSNSTRGGITNGGWAAAPLPLGLGLQIKNLGSSASFVGGRVCYSTR